MHRRFDELSNSLLCSLGYFEGVHLFIEHAAPLHAPTNERNM